MEEIWKECHLSENYLISNIGNVYSRYRNNNSSIHISNKGYYNVGMNINGIKKVYTVHRLMMFAFKPNEYFEGAVINHIDCNKLNNSLDNLEWCTIKENNIHAHTNGLVPTPKGIEKSSCKLTEEKVLEIRKLYNEGISQQNLSKLYNICQNNVSLIVTNRAWKHLHWEPRYKKEKVVKEKLKSTKINTSYKLKEEDIPKIRLLFEELKNYSKVGKEFGISDNAVRKIIYGKTWNHVL